MVRFSKLFCTIALAVAAMLVLPNLSRADFELVISEDSADLAHSVVVDIPANTGPASFSGSVGTGLMGAGTDFSVVTAFGFSNSPGSTNAISQVGSLVIINTTGGTHTLHISVSAQGFTSPNSPPPVNVEDTVSGTLVNGMVTGTAHGTADATNALFGTGFTDAGLAMNFSETGLSKSFSKDGQAGVGFSPNGATYSLSFFENLTLTGGSALTLTGGNVQTVATPAPSSAVLALSALPLLGLGVWVRRRMSRKVTAAA